MNCPSRTEEPEGDGFNQNPSSLSADLTTREDLNGIANARELRRIATNEIESEVDHVPDDDAKGPKGGEVVVTKGVGQQSNVIGSGPGTVALDVVDGDAGAGGRGGGNGIGIGADAPFPMKIFMKIRKGVTTYGKFVGPGFMVCYFSVVHLSSTDYDPVDFSGLHRPWKLLDRCSCWCYVPVQIALHRSDVEHLCHFPTELVHQAWECQWTQSSGSM